MNANLKIFSMGIVGGIAGIFIFGFLMIGIFWASAEFSKIEMVCQQGKQVKDSDVACELSEVKDLGGVLKAADAVSNYGQQKRSDRETSEKFIKVMLKINNERNESIGLSEAVLIDGKGRKYQSAYDLSDWIDSNYKTGNIGPGLNSVQARFFEVPKDSENFKVKIKIFKNNYTD